jgi:RND family efflux transporter MFP subunit
MMQTIERETEFSEQAESQPPQRRSSGLAALAFLAAAAAVIGALVYFGIHARAQAETRLKEYTERAAIPAVNVVQPKPDAPAQEISLPGNTQAFTDAPIYARTNGYLKRWYFDIGAHVKQGDLLAEIDTPEVDQQLLQARADLETARANLALAQTTATRWQNLVKTGSVSQQETDQTVGTLNAQKATADSNEANVRRLEQLQSFEKVVAPFDGVVTARETDTGQLIDAGSGQTSGKQLFHLAAISKLRVFVAVPEVYSVAAQGGADVTLTLDEYPGQIFKGTVVRNSHSIDAASRTLLVEVDVDNPQGKLLPGAYVFVHFKLPEAIRSVTVPANTLLFRSEGLRIGVIHNGKAALVPVTIGRDYGTTVEIVSGVTATDQVIVDPPDSLVSDAPVRLATQQAEGTGQ